MDNNLENSLNESLEEKNETMEETMENQKETIGQEEAASAGESQLEDDHNKKDKEDTSFIQLLIASFADVTAISALTFIGIFLFKLILKVGGWRVKAGSDIIIYLIAFIIMSIIYAPICAKTKLGATIGQKLFYLKLKKED
ncbi:hypothetical protein ACPWSR_14670 [Alloiococcus sp. CFN-8]|uniref:hypothetical protein n=1 Tax=Alloiococcus sp. CFN-8 TaxID=3416081 RepID=UPI003CF56ECB